MPQVFVKPYIPVQEPSPELPYYLPSELNYSLPVQYASLTPPNQVFAQEQPNINILPAEQEYWTNQEKAGMKNVYEALAKPVKKLLGIGGEERYQTWPERTIRSALALPAEVLQGRVQSGPGLRREDVTDIPGTAQPLDPLMERAQDVAGVAGGTMFAGVKPGVASLGAGPVRKMTSEMIEKAPMFYSNVENAVKNAKINTADANQWLGYLKNQPGVKPEELEWTLGNLPQGKITKQQLEQHVAENKVQLGEIWKGEEKLKIEPSKDYEGEFDVIDEKGKVRFTGNSKEEANTYINEEKELGGRNPTKYQSYQLPNGENYRELLLTLPQKEISPEIRGKRLYEIMKEGTDRGPWETLSPMMRESWVRAGNEQKTAIPQEYHSSHWDEPNVLAHVRMNDREIPGVGKSLHIEEIQSDWGQAGRKQGFKSGFRPEDFDIEELPNKGGFKLTHKPTGAEIDTYKTKGEANTFIRKGEIPTRLGNVLRPEDVRKGEIPNMPMEKTWDELTIKRMIKEAADNGYDAISWTPGEAQAARYDLSKQVDSIEMKPEGVNKHIVINAKSGVHASGLVDKDGKIIQGYDAFRDAVGKPLSDVVGKEMAEKIIAKDNEHKFEGLDLKVGGEGMKAFYDKMMVDKANALAKKFGGKVETKEIKAGGKSTDETEMPTARPIAVIKNNNGYTIKLEKGDITWGIFDNETLAEKRLKVLQKAWDEGKQPVHVLKLTPELKKVATEKGFPLFTGGLQFPKPLEQPTFDERWRDRVPEEFIQNDEIKNFLDNDKIRPYPTNIQAPGRFNDKRQIRLTKVDYNPFK